MKLRTGTAYTGQAGSATELIREGQPDRPDHLATVACWYLECPGQSLAWSDYVMWVIHLRPIDGVKPPWIKVPGSTHEVIVAALDPDAEPKPDDHQTWRVLAPVNVVEQIQVPDDDAARTLADSVALSVVQGLLPAEPLFSGAIEPWRSTLIKTAAHLRGEEHAT